MKVNETLYPIQGNKRGIDYTVTPRAFHTEHGGLLDSSCIATVSRSKYAPYNTQFSANIQRSTNPVENVRKTTNAQQSMVWLVGEYNTYMEMDLSYTNSGNYGLKKYHDNYYANISQSNIPVIVNYNYRKLIGNLYVKVGIKNGSNMFSSFVCSLQYYITNYKSNDNYVIIQAFISNIWGGDFYQNARQQTIAGINTEYITTYDFSATVEKSYPCYYPMTMQGMNQNLTIQNPPSVPNINAQYGLSCNLPVFNCTSPHRMSDSSYGADYYNPSYDAFSRMGGIFGFGIPDETQIWNCGYSDQKGLTYYLPKSNDVEIVRKMAATYGIILNDNDYTARLIDTGTTETELLSFAHLIIPIMENDTTYNGDYIYTGDGTTEEITANLERLNESERTTIIINGGNPYENGYNPDLIDDNDYVDEIDLATPTLTGIDAFNRSYIINRNDVDELGRLFWSGDDNILDLIVKAWGLFGEKPINGVINLMLFPFDVREKTGSTTTTENIILGSYDTGINAYRLAQNANARYRMGSFKWFTRFDNSFLDYSPYTEAELYIPFFGVMPLPNEHFLNKKLEIELVVDFITGAGTAIIYVIDGDRKHPVIYKNATIGIQIPVSGDDAQQRITAIMDNSLKAFDTFDKIAGGVVDAVTGNWGEAWGELTGGVKQLATPEFKPATMYQTAGSSTPECSLYLPIRPYVILYYPEILDVGYYAHTVGFATMEDCIIGQCSGFNIFANVDLSGVPATQSEIDTIKRYLETGVYI